MFRLARVCRTRTPPSSIKTILRGSPGRFLSSKRPTIVDVGPIALGKEWLDFVTNKSESMEASSFAETMQAGGLYLQFKLCGEKHLAGFDPKEFIDGAKHAYDTIGEFRVKGTGGEEFPNARARRKFYLVEHDFVAPGQDEEGMAEEGEEEELNAAREKFQDAIAAAEKTALDASMENMKHLQAAFKIGHQQQQQKQQQQAKNRGHENQDDPQDEEANSATISPEEEKAAVAWEALTRSLARETVKRQRQTLVNDWWTQECGWDARTLSPEEDSPLVVEAARRGGEAAVEALLAEGGEREVWAHIDVAFDVKAQFTGQEVVATFNEERHVWRFFGCIKGDGPAKKGLQWRVIDDNK